ncbi:MAG: hypothetical protein GX754_05720 [Clostridiaceae bacterium]|nr:hypothetical protein [Clostridiaceae bacterium]
MTQVKVRNTMYKMLLKKDDLVNRARVLFNNIARRFPAGKGGFGMNEILGIAAGIIIAALIVVPGLKGLTNSIMQKLKQWWEGIENDFFSFNG